MTSRRNKPIRSEINAKIGDQPVLFSSNYQLRISPRPAGPLDFPSPAGGGGAFERPLPWGSWSPSRKTRGGVRKLAENHFGHFWVRSKLRSPGVKTKKKTERFFDDKSYILNFTGTATILRPSFVNPRPAGGGGQILPPPPHLEYSR